MATFRTDETQAQYNEYRANPTPSRTGCWICDKEDVSMPQASADAPLNYKHWRIVANSFPYDKIAAVHHMITPVRHATEDDVTEEEWAEFAIIKRDVLYKQYEYTMQATPVVQTIPGHYHLHLFNAK